MLQLFLCVMSREVKRLNESQGLEIITKLNDTASPSKRCLARKQEESEDAIQAYA